MPPSTTTTNDHDLLVRLDTKLDALSASFAEVKIAVAGKADSVRVEKLELAMDSVKGKLYTIGGSLGAMQLGVELALHWLLGGKR